MRNDGGFLLWWDGLRSEMQPIHDSQGVFAVLEKEVRRLGFDYYAYGVRHTIPFTRPKTEVHGTYPKAWLERYQMQNYGAVDPAILNGLRSSEMVVWSDSLFDQSRMLWNEARDWGLCVGATLPIRAPNNLLSVLSVARDQQNISSFEREEIRLRLRCMIELLTQKLTDLEHPMLMSNPVCLSHREREILQWTADGKSSGEIAIILSISESTVNFHHKNIQKKFDAPNKTLAAAYAGRGAGPHLKRRARRPARPTRSGRLPAVHPPLVFPLMCVLVCPPTERAQEYQGRDAAFFFSAGTTRGLGHDRIAL
ncbi:regulatory protein rhlR [Pseudomonas aeruginosa X24509]|nr:regulatory protein rhlR [Pseudomonas aeruginosa X24509]